jgi:hypothetical protein
METARSPPSQFTLGRRSDRGDQGAHDGEQGKVKASSWVIATDRHQPRGGQVVVVVVVAVAVVVIQGSNSGSEYQLLEFKTGMALSLSQDKDVRCENVAAFLFCLPCFIYTRDTGSS